jgi:3-oxoacyl-[acyl-carrier-protein] synthase II
MRRVAITGLGLASPLGDTPDALAAALGAGRPAVARLDGSFASRLASPIAARARTPLEARFPGQKLRMLDRVGQLGLAAAQDAIAAAGLVLPGTDPARVGVFVGTGMGGAQTLDDGYRTLYGENSDRMRPFSVLTAMAGAPAAWIAQDHGVTGPCLTYSTACSSSSVAIGEALLRLRAGAIDVAVAGGAEAPLTLGTMQAWEALRTVATPDPDDASTSCRPFSRDRSGLVLGEGAAMAGAGGLGRGTRPRRADPGRAGRATAWPPTSRT